MTKAASFISEKIRSILDQIPFNVLILYIIIQHLSRDISAHPRKSAVTDISDRHKIYQDNYQRKAVTETAYFADFQIINSREIFAAMKNTPSLKARLQGIDDESLRLLIRTVANASGASSASVEKMISDIPTLRLLIEKAEPDMLTKLISSLGTSEADKIIGLITEQSGRHESLDSTTPKKTK